MEYLGENAVFFSSDLLHAVSSCTSADPDILLVKVLWDFLPRQLRDFISRFDRSDRRIPGPLTSLDREAIEQQIHIFDRRRLYYLHYGAIDQSRIFRMRETAFRPLLGQSRDEREYYFSQLEKTLDSGEYRNYVFAIFNLQLRFSASFAAYLPEGLPQDEIAEHFSDALCSLNSSPSFWKEEGTPEPLHPHLVRYLIMFFDHTPRNRSFAEEYVRQFMNSHRTFRWPGRQGDANNQRILKVFGRSWTDLKKLNREDLNRLYRKKAMELHPDRGGDHDRFVELTEAYNLLTQRKR
jgi:hypothetical protein